MPEHAPEDLFAAFRDAPVSPGTPPLPPGEVRRRGDRLRRRRTALAAAGVAAAVVAAIGAPVVLGGGDGLRGGRPQVATRLPGDPQPTRLTSIPDGFILADGFPATDEDGSPVEVRSAAGVDRLEVCGTTYLDARDPAVLDVAGTTYTGGAGEDLWGRSLLLYADAGAAEEAVGLLAESFKLCGPDNRGDRSYVPLDGDSDAGAEQSLAYAAQVTDEGGPIGDNTVVRVVRVGTGVLLSTRTAMGRSDEGYLDGVSGDMRSLDAPVVAAMCAFAGTCEGSEVATAGQGSASASATPGGTASSIPADLDLAAGLPDPGSDGERIGPSADGDGVDLSAMCGYTGWNPSLGVDRLAVSQTGPQYPSTRELVVFETTQEARRALDNVQDAVLGCPSVGGDADAESPEDRFYDVLGEFSDTDRVVFGQTYRAGLGGGLYAFTRVGRAVLATYSGGEWSRETLPRGASEESRAIADVYAQLCLFTDRGC